jgi:hypothetical protein
MAATVPAYTGNAAGNVITSGTLAAGANQNASVDYSAVFEGQLHVKNTPGGTVAGTRGVRIDIFRRYASGPTTGESPMATYFLPSQTASTAESLDIFLSPGKYNIKLTNLDASNAITTEVTGDTVHQLTTT